LHTRAAAQDVKGCVVPLVKALARQSITIYATIRKKKHVSNSFLQYRSAGYCLQYAIFFCNEKSNIEAWMWEEYRKNFICAREISEFERTKGAVEVTFQ